MAEQAKTVFEDPTPIPAEDLPTEPGETAVKVTKVEELTPATKVKCPHCKTNLQPHNDSIGAQHCNSVRCIGCCFTLDDNGEPVLRPGYGVCPSA